MTTNGAYDRDHLIKEVEMVLASEPAALQFRLRLITDGVEHLQHGWAVPVASGVEGGSGYDLSRAIDRVQELVELRTNEQLSVFLDPFGS